MSESTKQLLAPLKKTVEVAWAPEAAFRRFTAEIATWWPLRSHSVGGERARSVVFESHVGGHIYEVGDDGSTSRWGTVLAWEPPNRVQFTFHPGQSEDLAQNIDVRFVAAGEGTRLELTHTGWERLGRQARMARRGYNVGWSYVLDVWAAKRGVLVMLVHRLERVMRITWRIRQLLSAGRGKRDPRTAAH